MPLSNQQLASLESLEWLVSNTARGSGRTLALAVAAIRYACRHPGEFVQVFDHIDNTRTRPRQYVMDFVLRLVRADPLLRLYLYPGREDSFRLELPAPVHDWLPSEPPLYSSGRVRTPLERQGPRFIEPSWVGTPAFRGGTFAAPQPPTGLTAEDLQRTIVAIGTTLTGPAQDSGMAPPVERLSVWERLMADD